MDFNLQLLIFRVALKNELLSYTEIKEWCEEYLAHNALDTEALFILELMDSPCEEETKAIIEEQIWKRELTPYQPDGKLFLPYLFKYDLNDPKQLSTVANHLHCLASYDAYFSPEDTEEIYLIGLMYDEYYVGDIEFEKVSRRAYRFLHSLPPEPPQDDRGKWYQGLLSFIRSLKP